MSNAPDNYNPIHHDCQAKGCWNAHYRPNIEYFYHALPRRLTMSDIDGVAEVNGSFSFLEWKSHKGPLPTGQRILAERLTKLSPKIVYIVVQHVPEYPMSIENIMVVRDGKFSDWIPCSIEGLFKSMKRWASDADIKAVEAAE